MKHVSILSSALGLAFALHAASAAAAVPATSAVEGTLQAAGGGAAADGVYAITFGLYNKEVGGNPLWVEGPINIGVKSGQWSHALGTKSALSPSVVNGASVWLGVQIGSDPELPRQPLASTAFAVRAAVAEALECSGCVGAGAIDPKVFESMVKKSDLAAVALSGNFSDLKGGPDLSAYAKTAALAAVATSGNYSDLKGAPDLAPYAKAAALAAVAQSGSYNDLKDKPAISDAGKTGNYGDLQNKPVLPQLGKSCGTGLVMAGIKADGSYDCSVSAIAPDMIDEVSNGLIWNQFVDSTNGGVKVPIPDGNGAGKSDSLDFPDIGSAQAIWVNVDILTSDLSAVTIELYGPGMATPYVLYAKGKTGNTLKAAFNKDTPIAQGDMNKDWIGKNPKGLWSLIVKDPLKNQMPPAVNDGEFTWSLAIQTLSTKKIQVKGNLIVDGTTDVAGGLRFGTPAAACDATSLGLVRTDKTWGVQVCQKNWDKSDKVVGYSWVQLRNSPVMWSGGCTSHSQGSDWDRYCLNGTDFNTADPYLNVNTNGVITVKISGYYRLNYWIDQHGCQHKRASTRINGIDRAYAHQGNTDHRWNSNFNDFLWPLRKDDTVEFWAHHDGGCNPYRWHSWNKYGQHSRVQVEYMGPLQEGYVMPPN